MAVAEVGELADMVVMAHTFAAKTFYRALRLATSVVAEAPILCTHKFAHIVTNKVLLYPIIHSMHLNIPRQIFQSPEYVCERLRRFRRTCMFILHLSDESVAALTP